MFLVALAHAASPWECPAITTPEEASPWRGSDLGARDAIVVAWDTITDASASCAWTITESGEIDHPIVESVCVTGDIVITEYEETVYTDTGWESTSTHTWSLEATASSGTWSTIRISTGGEGFELGSFTYGGESVLRAEWSGSITGLPDDESVALGQSTYTADSFGEAGEGIAVETSACTFVWEWNQSAPDLFNESVITAPGIEVEVDSKTSRPCPYAYAAVNGVDVGAVSEDTWAYDAGDLDHDGYTPTCDCDESDASVNPEGREILADGIDQDCNGGDLADADLDGYYTWRGTISDCDDTNSAVHPDATEVTCDGVDDDCDGSDLCLDTGDTAETGADTAVDTGSPDTADSAAPRPDAPPEGEEPAACATTPGGAFVLVGLLIPLLRRSIGKA